jgi:cellulose synthase/poly-beta-1,6-N-acetylglucosamine synthase-like glycosyltransferase
MQHGWTILWYIYLALELLLASFLVHPLVLLVIYGIARAFGRRAPSTPFDSVTKEYQFGIIVTAHRETDLIPPIIDSLLKQTHKCFNVYVVADDCDTSRLIFRDTRIHILKPPTPLNDQLASLDYGWSHLGEHDEILVIFDPDNLVHPEFLRTLNAWYNKGYRAVCARMHSKNRETAYAQIDNWGATLSNFIERDMRSFLGLSTNICGTGISLHKDIYANIHYDRRSQTGGFDKQLQMGTAKGVHRIAYARDAVFYDEKVGDGHNFERQRIRWIAAHFKFLGNAFHLLLTGFRRLDGNLIYFGYNLIRPPYFILLLLSFSCMVADWFIAPGQSIAWLACFAAFTVSFLLIVAKEQGSFAQALLYVPRIFYRQFRALLRLRLNKGSLLKTTHSKIVYIDDILSPSLKASPPPADPPYQSHPPAVSPYQSHPPADPPYEQRQIQYDHHQ